MSFFSELKRRNVFKVTIAYIVMAWLVMQVADVILNNVGAPNWVFHVILLLLGIGLLFAIFFAWAFELTPEGIKKEKEIDRTQSITHITARKLNFLIIVVMAVALGYFAYYKFVLSVSREAAMVEAITQAGSEKVTAEQEVVIENDKSIAVLPFVNMSDDDANEYFSDGISEELLNLLAKIPEFRVISRSSAFSYKGKDFKIADVGRELNVSYVLEGSVRKAGNKVRITAQLIEVDSDTHQWSDTYDRTLDDIFNVQDEIASRVASALELTLLGQTQSERKVDPEIYALWLKALYFLNQRGEDNYRKSEEVLLQAIELQPDYANAWELLAMTYYAQMRENYRAREEGHALVMRAIDRAMSLEPNQGTTQGAFGFLKKNLDWDWDTAQSALAKAHQLDPSTNVIRIWRGSLAQTLGHVDEAIETYKQAMANDPLNMSAYSALGYCYQKARRFDDAIAVFEKQIALKPDYYWAYFNLGRSHLFKGNAERALVEIQKNPPNMFRDLGLVFAYSMLEREEEARKVLQALISEFGEQHPVWIAEAYSWLGEKDQAFEWLERGYIKKDLGLSYVLGNNVFDNLRSDSRWVDLLQKLGLLEYWQAMPVAYGGPVKVSS